jgi:hypothetical protein
VWIVVRLGIALLGFAARLIWRGLRSSPDGTYDGVPYFVSLRKRKRRITGFRLGVELSAPWFRLHRESFVDRLFKAFGLATEPQTQDPAFDDRVYVGSDDDRLEALLRTSSEARGAILAALDGGFTRIRSDGAVLWLSSDQPREPMEHELRLITALRKALAPLTGARRRTDPFLWKTILLEGLVWSVIGYAVAAVPELITHQVSPHVRPMALVVPGLWAAGAAYLALIGLTAALMRGSARGHIFLLESALALVFALPPAGIQGFADANRALDRKEPVLIQRTILRTEERVHRGRRGRRWFSYHLHIEGASGDPFDVPTVIDVDRAVYSQAGVGAQANLLIRPGFFGHPWYSLIEVRRGPGVATDGETF